MNFDDPLYLEAVYAALFALLKGATYAGGIAFRSMARVMEAPDTVPVAEQPALRVVPGPMHAEQMSGGGGVIGPTKWTLTAVAVVYARAEATAPVPDPLPATVVNYIIWGLQNAFVTRPPYEKQTLGGLVYHCWIEGVVQPEIQSGQIVISVPIYILTGPVD